MYSPRLHTQTLRGSSDQDPREHLIDIKKMEGLGIDNTLISLTLTIAPMPWEEPKQSTQVITPFSQENRVNMRWSRFTDLWGCKFRTPLDARDLLTNGNDFVSILAYLRLYITSHAPSRKALVFGSLAQLSAVLPEYVASSGSAPYDNNTLSTATWPPSAASWIGLQRSEISATR